MTAHNFKSINVSIDLENSFVPVHYFNQWSIEHEQI